MELNVWKLSCDIICVSNFCVLRKLRVWNENLSFIDKPQLMYVSLLAMWYWLCSVVAQLPVHDVHKLGHMIMKQHHVIGPVGARDNTGCDRMQKWPSVKLVLHSGWKRLASHSFLFQKAKIWQTGFWCYSGNVSCIAPIGWMTRKPAIQFFTVSSWEAAVKENALLTHL